MDLVKILLRNIVLQSQLIWFGYAMYLQMLHLFVFLLYCTQIQSYKPLLGVNSFFAQEIVILSILPLKYLIFILLVVYLNYGQRWLGQHRPLILSLEVCLEVRSVVRGVNHSNKSRTP